MSPPISNVLFLLYKKFPNDETQSYLGLKARIARTEKLILLCCQRSSCGGGRRDGGGEWSCLHVLSQTGEWSQDVCASDE